MVDPPTTPSGIVGRLRLVLLVLTAVGIMVAGASLAFVGPASTGDPRAGTTTDYTLTSSNRSDGLSFPNCNQVSVTWQVVAGGVANFSVWPPEAVVVGNCPEPALSPPPASCPAWACGGASMGPGPVCFEVGMSGACSFSATQAGYTFLLDSPYSPTNGSQSLGGLAVDFVVTYSNCAPPPHA